MGKTADVDIQAVLARRLKAARALSGKKVRDLAGELGWSDEKLYRLERGTQIPDALELSEIAAATNQPLDFFLGDASSAAEREGAVLTDQAVAVKDNAA
jgi:transcriptional regulator with XRE-family HTH domain